MLSTLLSSVSREYVNLVDIVAYRRPAANRLFDQIYMMEGDMLTQVDIMKDYLSDKDVIFMGDGDGMSMLFGLFASRDIISSPKSISVLDFDERIVNNVVNFSKEYHFNEKLSFLGEILLRLLKIDISNSHIFQCILAFYAENSRIPSFHISAIPA